MNATENSAHVLRLRPRAPFIAGDGRPFTADPGARAGSLDWPLPQTIAGALRTHIGGSIAFDWHNGGSEQARAIAVHGPLLVAQHALNQDWQAFLPAPRDALQFRDEAGVDHCRALRPSGALPEGAGTDLPAGLRPLEITEEVKPDSSAPYWSLEDCTAWLSEASHSQPPARTLGPIPREQRVHVAIDHTRGAARPGMLFTTEGLAFPDVPQTWGTELPRRTLPQPAALAMLCRVRGAPAAWMPSPCLAPMGGERRLTEIEPAPAADWPDLPPRLSEALPGSRRIRLQLVTPAIFPTGGWRPDWLAADTLEGSPPGLPDLRLRLVAAASGRRIPVSGWDLNIPGPKPARWAVPSGSVYFFDVAGGEVRPAAVEALWLASIVPDPQDQRDGFGLAVPGVW